MANEATPARFARLSTPDVDRAVAAVYALITTCDGKEDKAERDRFFALIGAKEGEDDILNGIASDAFALAERMATDFDGAARVASARLKALADKKVDTESRMLVIDVARSLIVADGVLHRQEEGALTRIAKDLGLPNIEF